MSKKKEMDKLVSEGMVWPQMYGELPWNIPPSLKARESKKAHELGQMQDPKPKNIQEKFNKT